MNASRSFEDVVRRAELFSYIAELVQTLPPTAPPPLAAVDSPAPHAQRRLETVLPRITALGGRIVCNGEVLDLSRKPKMYRLFEAFIRAPEQTIATDDLVHALNQYTSPRSPRFLASAHSNAVKLVSRARNHASRSLSRGAGDGLEWFVYDTEARLWQLYRLRTRYLAEKLG